MEYTKWHACDDGECPCKQIWADDYPVATVSVGKWGNDFPAIRLVGNSSWEMKAEAYMEQITYGEISEEIAAANIRLIAQAPRMAELLKRMVKDGWSLAIAMEAKEIIQMLDARKAIAKAEGK